jgi:DNA-binding NarL/FixJ family response regulator
MNPPRPITLMCVDDHALVREGIAQIINLQADMKVVASAATVEEAIRLFDEHQPDVTLMDLQLGPASGLDAIAAIRARHPDARIIVLTMYLGQEDIYRALQRGAATYIVKDMLSKDLIRVVREVHEGRARIPERVAAVLAERDDRSALTKRETEVLRLMAEGKRNKEIADILGIQNETVHAHIRSAYLKLEVNDRTGAVAAAVRRGIIRLT